MKVNMTNPSCMIVLNHLPRPEGSQMNKSKDHGELGGIFCNQCTGSLILGS